MRRVLPALVLLLVLALGALAGGPVPSPVLQTASTTNPTPPSNVRSTS